MKGSKKLSSAIAGGNVVVKNMCSGEVALMIKGKSHVISSKGTLDVTALVDQPSDVARIGKLQTMLQQRMLVLV